MSTDPIHPVVTQAHLQAIDTRLEHILDVIDVCVKKFGEEHVLVDEWTGERPKHTNTF